MKGTLAPTRQLRPGIGRKLQSNKTGPIFPCRCTADRATQVASRLSGYYVRRQLQRSCVTCLEMSAERRRPHRGRDPADRSPFPPCRLSPVRNHRYPMGYVSSLRFFLGFFFSANFAQIQSEALWIVLNVKRVKPPISTSPSRARRTNERS